MAKQATPEPSESRRSALTQIGLATAQGGRAEISEARELRSASELPWPAKSWNVSRWCYPALGIDPALTGAERWRALARKALDEIGDTQSPLLVASCNGAAAGFQTEAWEQAFDTSALLKDTPWANERLPVFSSSCASGIHALYAAQQLLSAGAVNEVLVLAVDILSHSNHNNFEGLRVLAEKPGLGLTSTSFILGEAAVVIKITMPDQIVIALQSDLEDHPESVSLDTTLTRFGHTLGASGLLSVALGALTAPRENVLVNCRAMNGACAAVMMGGTSETTRSDWKRPATLRPLMNTTLKRLASEALDHRPSAPPDVLILRLEKPLAPPASAFIGERLLPSAVLEITPGFASQLIARCWGFTGAALCLVGDVDRDVYGLKNAFRESGLNVFQVNLRGSGDNRAIEWNA
jgi:hypothetical protein